MEKLILDWAKEKGILDSGTPNGQLSKLQEEFFMKPMFLDIE